MSNIGKPYVEGFVEKGKLPCGDLQVVVDPMEYATDAVAQVAYVVNPGTEIASTSINDAQGLVVGNINGESSNRREAQSFNFVSAKEILGASFLVASVTSGSPTGGIEVRIETDSSNAPSGTLVNANATAIVSSVTLNAWNTATFPAIVSLSAGTKYWLVFKCTVTQTGSNYWYLARANDTTFLAGFRSYFVNGAWSITTQCCVFKLAVSPGTNIVFDGTATGDSTTGNAYTDSCDNNESSAWYSANTAFPHWWKYDFGGSVTKTVTKIRLLQHSSNGYLKDFDFQGSNNNSTWDTLYSGTYLNNVSWQEFTFSNFTAYRYYRLYQANQGYTASNYLQLTEIEMSESVCLQSYSEATIKTQGNYSLKGVALITAGLNKTLTKTISPVVNLFGVNTVYFDIRASRTGAHLKVGLYEGASMRSEITPTIAIADTFQTVTWDISAVANADKDAIDKVVVTVVNADATNTFYIDNFVVLTETDLTNNFRRLQVLLKDSVYAGTAFSNGVPSTWTALYTAAYAYAGAVLDSAGTVHFVPYGASVGQKVNLYGTVSTYSLVYTLSTAAYFGGVLAPNGDIHFCPLSATRGQKVSASGVVSTYALVYTTGTAYGPGVVSPNGEIHFAPYCAPVGQKVSIAGVVSTYSLIYTNVSGAYLGACLAPNGDVHFIPNNASVGQKISAAGVVSTYSLAYTIAGAYGGGVISPNGDIHFVPVAAIVGQKISSAGVVSTYALASTVDASFRGGVLAPNGDIYFIPYGNAVGQKVSYAGVVSTYSYVGTSWYLGGVLTPNGDIYFARNEGGEQKISTLSEKPLSLGVCCSPFLNKY